MKNVRSAVAELQENLSKLSLPKLGREVAIPVFLIHNSSSSEDYYFIFDFEEFVERSQAGVFVRPKLKVWAGRDDFDRSEFASQFRQSFSQEFDAARSALVATANNKGWFGWLKTVKQDVVQGPMTSFVANVVLLTALSAGRLVVSQVLPAGWFQGAPDSQKLEESIEATKGKVDAALAQLELVLHRDLLMHAFFGQIPERYLEVDFDAWPLPGFVQEHLK